MKFLSKETLKLQKAFTESHLKDLRKLEGKCFLNLDVFEDCPGNSNGGMEAIMIKRVADNGTFVAIIASVIHNEDEQGDFADIAINEGIDVIAGEPCSRTEFDNVVDRAKALIEKQLNDIKGDKKKES